MLCLRKMILACLASVFLLSLNVALAVQTGPPFDDKGDGEPAREFIKKNLNIFFLVDVSESMRPFADYLNSLNRSVGAMKEEGLGIRINRVCAYWDSTASDRDKAGEPNFMRVKGLESIEFAHKSGDRNYAEPLMRAFKKVLDEIEVLENERLISPLHEKLLFIITDAGPNDLTDGAFGDIVAGTQHLKLRVYFVYPSRPGVRTPGPQMDDHPAAAYNQLEEMIARFEKSDSPGQATSFRRFQFETANMPSQNLRQEDFNRQNRRLLEAIEADLDHAEIERERAAAALFAEVVSELKSNRWEAARSRLYGNQGLFTKSLSSPQREQMIGLTAFFKTLEEGDRLLGESPRTIEGLDQALTAYGRAQAQATGLLPVIDVGFIAAEKSAAAGELQAALKLQQQQELAAAQKLLAEATSLPTPVVAAAPPPVVDRNAAIKQALSRFDEKNYTEALNHFTAVYGHQIDSFQQRDQRQIESLLSLPPKYRAEIVFLVEFDRIRQKSGNDRVRIKMGLEELMQDIENQQGFWVVIPEIRRERIKRHINEFQ